jgi:hypothetical protein
MKPSSSRSLLYSFLISVSLCPFSSVSFFIPFQLKNLAEAFGFGISGIQGGVFLSLALKN